MIRKYIIGVMSILGIGIIFSMCSNKTNAIEGYEWLEGEWVGYSDDDWGKIIVTRNTYKIAYSYNNENIEDITTEKERPINIKKEDNYIIGDKILALDKENSVIGIDESQRQLYIILGEYRSMYLQKIEEELDSNAYIKSEKTDEVSSEIIPQQSNMSTSLDFSKNYVREDDFLKGTVKTVEESLQEQDITLWAITKKYDTLGRITYFKRNGSDQNMLSTVYPKGFSIPEKIGGLNYSAFEEYGRYLNPVHMLGYYAFEDKRHSASEAFTFDYNDKGLIDKVYYENKLVNKCEYDEYGRLTTRYEGDLPTLKIIWNDNFDNIKRSSFEIRLYNTGGSLIKTILGEWNENVLKVGEPNSKIREYTFMGNELQNYRTNNYAGEYEYQCYLHTGNNTLEISEYIPRGGASYTLNYNDNGHLLEHIVKQGDKVISYLKWEYKYDEHGNWIEATQKKVTVGKDITFEEELNTITRKYEYYE